MGNPRFCCNTPSPSLFLFFFFNDTATTEIYTLSLHDALPISRRAPACSGFSGRCGRSSGRSQASSCWDRSEEHTSELQSQSNLVCRLLLEKKKHPSSGSTLCSTLCPPFGPA